MLNEHVCTWTQRLLKTVSTVVIDSKSTLGFVMASNWRQSKRKYWQYSLNSHYITMRHWIKSWPQQIYPIVLNFIATFSVLNFIFLCTRETKKSIHENVILGFNHDLPCPGMDLPSGLSNYKNIDIHTRFLHLEPQSLQIRWYEYSVMYRGSLGIFFRKVEESMIKSYNNNTGASGLITSRIVRCSSYSLEINPSSSSYGSRTTVPITASSRHVY